MKLRMPYSMSDLRSTELKHPEALVSSLLSTLNMMPNLCSIYQVKNSTSKGHRFRRSSDYRKIGAFFFCLFKHPGGRVKAYDSGSRYLSYP